MLEISGAIKEIGARIETIDPKCLTESIKQGCEAIKEKIKIYYRFDKRFECASSAEEAEAILYEQYYIGVEIMHDYNRMEKEMRRNSISE